MYVLASVSAIRITAKQTPGLSRTSHLDFLDFPGPGNFTNAIPGFSRRHGNPAPKAEAMQTHHDAGGGVGERSVADVRVPGDPADVSRAPEHIAVRLVIEHVLERRRRVQQVAGLRVQNALRLARRTTARHHSSAVLQEARLLQTDRTTRYVSQNLVNCRNYWYNKSK